MKRMYVIFVILVSTLLLDACGGQARKVAPAPETVRNVGLLEVQERSIPDVLEAVGTVRAAQTSTLASQMMGSLIELRAHEGDRVQRGQVLAVIDESQPRAALDRAIAAEAAARQQLASAESELNLAESTLKRFQALYERKSVSPQEFEEVKTRQQAALAHRDMARAGQEQASAAVSQARTALEYSRIRAPFEGVITEKKADTGVLALPGDLYAGRRAPVPPGGLGQRNGPRCGADRGAGRGSHRCARPAGTPGQGRANRSRRGSCQPQFPDQGGTARRPAAALWAFRARAVYARGTPGNPGAPDLRGRTRADAGSVSGGPEPDCGLALRHAGKALATASGGAGRAAAGRPAGGCAGKPRTGRQAD